MKLDDDESLSYFIEKEKIERQYRNKNYIVF